MTVTAEGRTFTAWAAVEGEEACLFSISSPHRSTDQVRPVVPRHGIVTASFTLTRPGSYTLTLWRQGRVVDQLVTEL